MQQKELSVKSLVISIVSLSIIVLLGLLAFFSIETVQVGYVKVATLFGNVQGEYTEGLHFVNPLYKFHSYDVREKSHKFNQIEVPSADQLTTLFDISINYRVDKKKVAESLAKTGNAKDLVEVHMIPKFRSLVREISKGISTAEEFYNKEIQKRMQEEIYNALREYCKTKGIIIQQVLIRSVRLPKFITDAVEQKKRSQQKAKEEEAKLERYGVEEKQKEVKARAELAAAKDKATQIRLLAEAEAYRIKVIADSLRDNPIYVQLQAIESLKEISKNPSSQIYFLNSDSPQPFPFLNIGKQE